MLVTSNHPKKILLIEDLERFYNPLMRWLREDGYQVGLARSYQEALTAIDSDPYHLAIVDIRLDDKDKLNEEGLLFLDEIGQRQLKDVMPCIVLTAYPNVSNVLKATQKLHVSRYIQKKGFYRTELLESIRELFEEEIRINFDLVYDNGSDKLVPEVANDINWSMTSRPQPEVLSFQVKDLLGRLLVKAQRVYVEKLKPGLTGAAIVLVRPTREFGLGRSYVVKIGRRDKVETERENYQEYVEPYLPGHAVTQVNVAYTRHLGALLYTFAENGEVPFEEFDEFYKHNQPEVIVDSLRNLFQNTCHYWYDHHKRSFEDLARLYYEAFELDRKKLVGRILVVLPQFDPDKETFQIGQIPVEATNPMTWLARHDRECVLPIYHSITHGDLTGRNIMVDGDGRCWLIDFYRTYNSHILRDFVILETDILYRLLPTPDFSFFGR